MLHERLGEEFKSNPVNLHRNGEFFNVSLRKIEIDFAETSHQNLVLAPPFDERRAVGEIDRLDKVGI